MRASARVGPEPEDSGPSATSGRLAFPVTAGKCSSQRSRSPKGQEREKKREKKKRKTLMASMCFTAPAGAPAVPGRRHECGRVQGWGPSRKIPARAPPAEGSRFQ
ncbi:hypothetical protein NDU88_004971 [Pleurodeles waltl]|uniref:Uncharacterized protein n=1 Tax=Pleurodeles waltl TaxID=8319 RepID=A0AAV7TAA9_PLEWA|nr:hypothetical protein NDU88_004971 [Pleurodeles waltl]